MTLLSESTINSWQHFKAQCCNEAGISLKPHSSFHKQSHSIQRVSPVLGLCFFICEEGSLLDQNHRLAPGPSDTTEKGLSKTNRVARTILSPILAWLCEVTRASRCLALFPFWACDGTVKCLSSSLLLFRDLPQEITHVCSLTSCWNERYYYLL